MPQADYAKAKLYKISSPNTQLVYIGSSCAPLLSARLSKHVHDLKRYKQGDFHFISSFIVLEAGDYKIELLELYPCEHKDQLRTREQFWLNEYGERACNQRRVQLTAEDKVEYRTKYVAANYNTIYNRCSCPCGGSFTTNQAACHKKTKLHQLYLQSS
jgi:hypothetical protein